MHFICLQIGFLFQIKTMMTLKNSIAPARRVGSEQESNEKYRVISLILEKKINEFRKENETIKAR